MPKRTNKQASPRIGDILRQLQRPIDEFSLSLPTEPVVTYRRFRDFVERVNLPYEITIGDEWVNTETPSIIMKRRGFDVQIVEFFDKPLFYIARKIRLRFHWEGIQVVGANMESPNCFVFPIPSNDDDPAAWTLKVICLPSCSPGRKKTYVTVDIIRENMVVRLLSLLAKIVAGLTFLALSSLPFIYYLSKSVRANINKAVLDTPDSSLIITLPVLVIFILIIFSKRFDELLSVLMQKTDAFQMDEEGNKIIGGGIFVKAAPKKEPTKKRTPTNRKRQ